MTLSIEVLPAPFGPMMARISPLRISKETSLTALTPPNDSDTSSTASSTSPVATSERGEGVPRHAAFSIGGEAGTVAMSRILTRALIVPLRPSSKVTSVEMSASLEPS